MKLVLSLILLVISDSAVQGQIPVGRSINYPSGTQRNQDGLPVVQRSYAESRLGSHSTRRNTPSHSDDGLTLYEDFVNDPWKPTEDLGTLLSQRSNVGAQRNQLRSGGSYDSRDDVWSHRQPISRDRSPITEAAQTRSFNPIYGNDGNGYWSVSSRDDNHITYVRRAQYVPNPNPAPLVASGTRRVESQRRSGPGPHSVVSHSTRSGPWESTNPPTEGDDNWIVESRSDGHITYRKRVGSQTRGPAGVHGWREASGNTGVRTLGHGDGKVLARVVNTATDDFASVHSGYNPGKYAGSGPRSGLASYKSMRTNYAHDDSVSGSGKSHLQLKSGDHVSYRRKDGNEAVYNRYRQPTTTTTPAPPPVHYQQEGDWRVVSKGDSHITWSRVGSEIEQPEVPTVQHRTGRYYGSGPHYPMMRERAFKEHDTRLGSTNVLAY